MAKVIKRCGVLVVEQKRGARKVIRKKVRPGMRRDDLSGFKVETRRGTTDQGGILGVEQKYVVKERDGSRRDAAWFIKRLDEHADKKVARVEAMRRQVCANGRDIEWQKCRLVKKKVKGKWRLLLKGGITGKEWLDADWHAGDCFYSLRLHGWTVHQGRKGKSPKKDHFWVPGRAMHSALKALGWV